MTAAKKYFLSLSITKQFFLARTVYDWAIFIFDAFYMTYVFKESGEVRDVVINMLITFATIYLGFVLGSFFMRKVGAEINLKWSFVFFILTGVVGMMFAGSGVASFMLISVFRGIAEGFYWATVNLVELSGVPIGSRGKFYSVSQAVNNVFYIIAPVALGYLLVQEHNLFPLYMLFTAFCVIGIIIPFDFDINHKIEIKRENFQKLFTHKKVKAYVAMKLIIAVMWMIDWLMSSVIAFVILGDELNMGIFMAVSAFISAVLSLMTQNFPIHKKTTVGFILSLISSVSMVVFAFNLNTLGLYVNDIIRSITGSVAGPAEFDLSIRVSHEVLGDEHIGAEINIFQEGIYTVARFLFGGVFLLVYPLFTSTAMVLTVLIILFVITRIANYVLSANFLKIPLIAR